MKTSKPVKCGKCKHPRMDRIKQKQRKELVKNLEDEMKRYCECLKVGKKFK